MRSLSYDDRVICETYYLRDLLFSYAGFPLWKMFLGQERFHCIKIISSVQEMRDHKTQGTFLFEENVPAVETQLKTLSIVENRNDLSG